jgi:hypothetical protein
MIEVQTSVVGYNPEKTVGFAIYLPPSERDPT